MSGLKEAVLNSTKTKYLERIEEYLRSREELLDEHRNVVRLNEIALKIIENSNDSRSEVESITESFKEVIKQTKVSIDSHTIKIEAAKRIREKINKNELVHVEEFLLDFDKMAGQ
jgi:3-hydroxyisobutyrate dehydrogenase-like beta-hydroxyacid dehydrogenase